MFEDLLVFRALAGGQHISVGTQEILYTQNTVYSKILYIELFSPHVIFTILQLQTVLPHLELEQTRLCLL